MITELVCKDDFMKYYIKNNVYKFEKIGIDTYYKTKKTVYYRVYYRIDEYCLFTYYEIDMFFYTIKELRKMKLSKLKNVNEKEFNV